MDKNYYCVIMAGGAGTRFWPVSRTSCPKQFLDIAGTGKSFLRYTFERFAGIIPVDNIIVVTTARYADLVKGQIPELAPSNLLVEPYGPVFIRSDIVAEPLIPGRKRVARGDIEFHCNGIHGCELQGKGTSGNLVRCA